MSMLPNFTEINLELPLREANKARRKRRKLAKKHLKLCDFASKRPVTKYYDGLFILGVIRYLGDGDERGVGKEDAR